MPRYRVTLVRDLSEYADIEVEAADALQAEDLAIEHAEDPAKANTLHWHYGDDRESLFAVDAEELP